MPRRTPSRSSSTPRRESSHPWFVCHGERKRVGEPEERAARDASRPHPMSRLVAHRRLSGQQHPREFGAPGRRTNAAFPEWSMGDIILARKPGDIDANIVVPRTWSCPSGTPIGEGLLTVAFTGYRQSIDQPSPSGGCPVVAFSLLHRVAGWRRRFAGDLLRTAP